MLRVGNRVAQHVLQEGFQDTAGFLVDESADALHTTTTGQAPNSWLCDSLDAFAENTALLIACLSHWNFFSSSLLQLRLSGARSRLRHWPRDAGRSSKQQGARYL